MINEIGSKDSPEGILLAARTPSGESLEPIACHLIHLPGCTVTYKVDFGQEIRSREGSAPALGVEEEKGRRTEATCRLNHEGNDGSGRDGGGGVDSGVVLSFRAFVLGRSAILGQVGKGWGHLPHCCGGVKTEPNSNINYFLTEIS